MRHCSTEVGCWCRTKLVWSSDGAEPNSSDHLMVPNQTRLIIWWCRTELVDGWEAHAIVLRIYQCRHVVSAHAIVLCSHAVTWSTSAGRPEDCRDEMSLEHVSRLRRNNVIRYFIYVIVTFLYIYTIDAVIIPENDHRHIYLPFRGSGIFRISQGRVSHVLPSPSCKTMADLVWPKEGHIPMSPKYATVAEIEKNRKWWI